MSCTLAATFNGYIHTTYDDLIVFEACMSGNLSYALRRPEEEERLKLIRSGNVFVYEAKPGMKRWMDGVSWSPSRVLDNFLVYREVQDHTGKPKKRKQMAKGAIKCLNTTNKDWSLIGSLVDSYDFKQKGLVKKTISITFHGASRHLVSYYKCEDIKNGLYMTPSQHPKLQSITPRDELMTQEFKAPIFEGARADGIYNHLYGPVQMNYDYSSTVIPQGGIPMNYPPGPMDSHDTYQQPFLAQLQHEQLQCLMPWLVPHHSNEQQEAS
ncbi:hypothetical protein NCS55_01443100 [Fusarium keratoplasticum]|nr:hypothetical protein NCS55_01443100 [Fusarium keratoplasticum]